MIPPHVPSDVPAAPVRVSDHEPSLHAHRYLRGKWAENQVWQARWSASSVR